MFFSINLGGVAYAHLFSAHFHSRVLPRAFQSSLGANAILAVSMAVCRAGAASMAMSGGP